MTLGELYSECSLEDLDYHTDIYVFNGYDYEPLKISKVRFEEGGVYLG